MKKIVYYLIIAFLSFATYSCNDEWKDEQYKKYVSFTKSGVVNVYLRYNPDGGKINYTIPVEVSGSTINDRDIVVKIAVDPDTLDVMNVARYYNRDDMYFRMLEAKHYSFDTMRTTIPAGSDIGFLNVEFAIDELDLVEKYILPLNIVETSEYIPSPRKWYRRSLMRIIPFNDYSGVYSATGGKITELTGSTSISMETREMRVVDENTVFFYAGLTEEDARDRATYKVRANFTPSPLNPDSGTVILSADSTSIDFTFEPTNCYYKVEKHMDALQPYLQIHTTTLFLKYTYKDVSNPLFTVTYKFNGSYVMERRRNTLIPEEDQQEIFNEIDNPVDE